MLQNLTKPCYNKGVLLNYGNKSRLE